MAWGGKAFGAGIGAIVGGPVGALVGGALGALWDSASDEEGSPVKLLDLRHEPAVTPGGVSVMFTASFRSEEPLNSAYQVVVRFKNGDEYIHSLHASFTDNDGDLAAVGDVEVASKKLHAAGVCAIPTDAFGAWPSNLTVEVSLVDSQNGLVLQESRSIAWPDRQQIDDVSFLGALVCAGVAVVRADANLEQSEVRFLREYLRREFELDEMGMEGLRRLLKRENSLPASPRTAAARITPHTNDGLAEPLLKMLYACAAADGQISEAEEAWLEQFCAELKLPDAVRARARQRADRARAQHEPGSELRKHFELLELPETATAAEIKRAYRRLAADYHPDKVANMPRGFVEFANQRMRDLNAAYEALSARAKN